MPTIHLSHWGGHATPGAHGPGRRWSIMALPRRWERGEGTVPLFVPEPDDVRAVLEERLTPDEYRAKFLYLVAFRMRKRTPPLGISPGHLLAETPLDPVLVSDGDTLLCACGVAKARAQRCHRVWAAAFLALAGWEVVLDTAPLDDDMARGFLLRGPSA